MDWITLLFVLYWSFFIYHRVLINQLIKKYNVKTKYTFLGGGWGRQPKRYSSQYFVKGRAVYFSNRILTTKLRYLSDYTEVTLDDNIVLQNYSNDFSTDSQRKNIDFYAKKHDASSPYHIGNCKYGSSIRYKIYFQSLKEVQASGRKPCNYCKPSKNHKH